MLFDVRLVGLNRKIVFKELDFCVMTNLKFASFLHWRMLLKRGMGNGEWGMGNGEWGMGNGEWGMRNSGQR